MSWLVTRERAAEAGKVVKRPVNAHFVKLLFHTQSDRGMVLIPERSRCIRQGEIHEIVTTDRPPSPGDAIDHVGFLGFAEVACGGVVEAADVVAIDGITIGEVIGFDSCHYPNHYNIIIRSKGLETAVTLGIQLEATISFSSL